ncbi:uncharacterized protein LOC111704516 [Eurytemora carolleeae]|uniref:uncharacterized protein LOC111704516 n=1 Tax=Eurytemora carolleeae TaxID=1294199 RepID=UPI000C770C1B|nr:uncharacterized protein LOC111704516 [Eurytemora carolleeae]|eukprot:XP_023332537.1 uncharacterized protein LOC111704516 [Eurytemora affinis]
MAGNDGRGKIRKLLETAVIDHDHILQVSGYGSSSTITPDGLPEVPVFTFPYRVSLNIPHLAEKHEVEPSTVLKDSLRRHASEVSRIQVYKDIKVDEIPTQTKYLSKTFKRMWFHNQNTTIQLCQGVNLRSTSLDKDVKCTYIHYRDPYLLLGPFKLENLNLDPPVGIFRDFYTIRECESIKKRGRGNVKSTPFQGRGRTEYYNTQRVSKRVHLKEDGFKEGMSSSKRISLATKWIVHTQKWASDEYSLINYGIGGQIEVHVDYWNHENKRRGGSRIATFLGYVSQVGYGGRTVFPGLGLSVNPEQGSALFWYTLNSHEDYDSRYTLNSHEDYDSRYTLNSHEEYDSRYTLNSHEEYDSRYTLNSHEDYDSRYTLNSHEDYTAGIHSTHMRNMTAGIHSTHMRIMTAGIHSTHMRIMTAGIHSTHMRIMTAGIHSTHMRIMTAECFTWVALYYMGTSGC